MMLEAVPLSPLFDLRFKGSYWPTRLYGQDNIATCWFGMLLIVLDVIFLKTRNEKPIKNTCDVCMWTRP